MTNFSHHSNPQSAGKDRRAVQSRDDDGERARADLGQARAGKGQSADARRRSSGVHGEETGAERQDEERIDGGSGLEEQDSQRVVVHSARAKLHFEELRKINEITRGGRGAGKENKVA